MKSPAPAAPRPAASPASSRRGRGATRRVGDVALLAAGVALAIGSVALAAAMFLQDNHVPRINGLQYLAIFAKPRTPSQPAPAEAPRVAQADRPVQAAAVDLAPTGSIAHRPTDAPDMTSTGSIARAPAGESISAESYRVIAAEPGMAWLGAGAEIRVVRPGDVVPGLGRIGSIERRAGRWALFDDSGATLLAADKQGASGPGGEGPFSRRMIFGGD